MSVNGFIEEKISSMKNTGIKIRVYSMTIPIEAKKSMLLRLEQIKNSPHMVYSLINMIKSGINLITRRPMFTNVDKESMICSQFVQDILSSANIKLLKDNRIMTPRDFMFRRALRFEYVKIL